MKNSKIVFLFIFNKLNIFIKIFSINIIRVFSIKMSRWDYAHVEFINYNIKNMLYFESIDYIVYDIIYVILFQHA